MRPNALAQLALAAAEDARQYAATELTLATVLRHPAALLPLT